MTSLGKWDLMMGAGKAGLQCNIMYDFWANATLLLDPGCERLYL